MAEIAEIKIAELERVLGVHFAIPSFLTEAMVHRSFLHENTGFPLPSNERLEYLGDALLGLVVAQRLYALRPDLSEGVMTQLRSALVRRETLAQVAQDLKLGQFLLLGKGEAKSGGRRRQSTLACVLEAVIGAVLLDRGYTLASEFVSRLLQKEWDELLKNGLPPDYKSQFQEQVQSRGFPVPKYRVVESQGPPHSRSFIVEVWVGDKAWGRGQGRRKKDAEADAARNAMAALPTAPLS